MMLLRVCLRLSSNTKGRAEVQGLLAKEGRMFYDIPNYFTSSRFQYRINEDVPAEAKDFSLRGLTLRNFDDTPDFNKIPKLQHGLHKLLDGRIYQGDMGFGKIPELRKEVIAQMSDYVPPSQDRSLQAVSEQAQCRFSSSTSNISIPLIHLYFLFSMFRRPNFENVYEEDAFDGIKREHMNHFKKPSTFYLTKRKQDTPDAPLSYSVNADKGYSEEKTNEVLMQVGTFAEYLLTHTPETIAEIMRTGTVQEKP